MSAERKRGLLFGAVIAAGVLYGVGWLTLRDVPEPFVEWDIPADPKEKAAYDLAHSIQLPDSVPKPQPFRFCKTEFLGLCFQKATGREYFEHLCRTEAGEYIFNTVEGVEGIYQMRQRKEATSEELHSLYRMEDPYGYVNGETTYVAFKFVKPHRFRFFEQDAPGPLLLSTDQSDIDPFDDDFFRGPDQGESISRYSGYKGKFKEMRKDYRWTRSSEYGFSWRGIKRDRDREFGVAGGETVALDLKSNQVLGVRRGFALVRRPSNERLPNWEFTSVCPRFGIRNRDKDVDFTYWFIRKVIVPDGSNPFTPEFISKDQF
jgi:hypothetical protein